MKKILHNIRQKSEETRRHILHLLTIIIAIILFALWAYSLGSNFNDTDTQVKVKRSFAPFSVLKDNISSIW